MIFFVGHKQLSVAGGADPEREIVSGIALEIPEETETGTGAVRGRGYVTETETEEKEEDTEDNAS